MGKKLAFLTVGVLHEPLSHARSQGFVERVPSVYAAADRCDGFVARSIRDVQTFEHSWGPVRIPRCFAHVDDVNRLPSTLSIWDDLESVAAFAYHGVHGEAMGKRKEWFQSQSAPTYVAWWIDEGHRIDWNEACERLDHLHDHGPTPLAFTFSSPFDAEGRPHPIDPDAVRSKKLANVKQCE